MPITLRSTCRHQARRGCPSISAPAFDPKATSIESVAALAFGLALIGGFAAIYHPVGLALVVQDRDRIGMPLAINGVFGNLGVACAALVSGFLIDVSGWRSAFCERRASRKSRCAESPAMAG